MPIINGKRYNDVLWKVAEKVTSLPFAGLPGVEEVFISQTSLIKEYRKIRRMLRAGFKKKGMTFDEKNLAEVGSVPRGPKVIHIRIRPRRVELTRYSNK